MLRSFERLNDDNDDDVDYRQVYSHSGRITTDLHFDRSVTTLSSSDTVSIRQNIRWSRSGGSYNYAPSVCVCFCVCVCVCVCVSVCDEHRGISLLSIPGKILARVILIRLSELVNHLGILPDGQCGFRAGRSTIDMVFTVRSAVSNSANFMSFS